MPENLNMTPEQQEKWGNLTLSMAITEPGCGSDPSRVSTTAELDEATNEWVLNGEKIFVTTGIRAQGVVMWATIDKSAGRAGIKSFLVEKGTEGFEVATKLNKHGWLCSDTAELVLDDVWVADEQVLGTVHRVTDDEGQVTGARIDGPNQPTS